MSGTPNMAATVKRFSTPCTRHRRTAATKNAEGYPTATTTTATIRGHRYPAPGKVIDRQREGHRTKRIEMFGTTDDVVASVEGGPRGDDISFPDGSRFEVIGVAQWSGGPLGATAYRECTLVEVSR